MKKSVLLVGAALVAAIVSYAQVQPPALAPASASDGPVLIGQTNALDLALTNVNVTVVERTATNWPGGVARRVGEHSTQVLGQTVIIPLFSQEGTFTRSIVANFVYNGQLYTHALTNYPVKHLSRQFRMDGQTPVFFTNSLAVRSP